MQFHLLRALEQRWGPASRIAPVEIPENFIPKWVSRLQKQLHVPRKYSYYSKARLDACAQTISARLAQIPQAPVVFFGALPFVNCRPDQPYFIYTDGAFFIHYWEYNRDHTHSRSDIARICAAEAEFMFGATSVWCSSQWAADRIVKEYSIPSTRVRFVGTGPGDVPPPIEPVSYENFVVMIAADFERKRGRLAVEAVAAARRHGSDLGIKFIGARPPKETLKLPFVEWRGWLQLNQDKHRDLFANTMSRAGAHILLSRADLTPLAIPEAASYRKATIGTRVGGIPEMIEDGRTGWLVGTEDSAAKIGLLLANIFKAPDKLIAAGTAADSDYRSKWTWRAVAETALRFQV